MQEMITRSPTARVRTARPTSAIVPTPSWPRIRPSLTVGTSPFRMCRSVPQIVVVSTATITSVGSTILGSGTSCHAFWPGPWYTRAFIDVLLVGCRRSRRCRGTTRAGDPSLGRSVQPALDVRLRQRGADPAGTAGHRDTGGAGEHGSQLK